MRTRYLALIALCGAIAFGVWFVRIRNARVAQSFSQKVAVIPPPNTPGTPPPSSPSPQTNLPQNPAPIALPGRQPTDNPIPGKIAPRPRTVGEVARTMPAATAPVVSQPPPMPAAAPEVSSEEVAIDVDKIRLSLRDFRTVMGGNPVGTNKEITAALNGGNPKQARLLPEGETINANGELVDRWGTPYFFHQLSKDQMEIRSAGPDKKMYTEDDTVGR